MDEQEAGKLLLTYAELAAWLGVSPDGARTRAKRAGWRVVAGNDGRARVRVLASDLPARPPEQTPVATDAAAELRLSCGGRTPSGYAPREASPPQPAVTTGPTSARKLWCLMNRLRPVTKRACTPPPSRSVDERTSEEQREARQRKPSGESRIRLVGAEPFLMLEAREMSGCQARLKLDAEAFRPIQEHRMKIGRSDVGLDPADKATQREMWDGWWYDRFEIPHAVPADARRLTLEMGGESFGAALLHNVAPKTCRAFLEILPYTGSMIHCAWFGHAAFYLDRVPLVDKLGYELENRFQRLAPGDMVWDPFIEEVTFAYGRNAFVHFPTTIFTGDGRQHPGQVCIFGRIVENLDGFAVMCKRLRYEGTKSMTTKLS